jgi:Uma2 family endonuclease
MVSCSRRHVLRTPHGRAASILSSDIIAGFDGPSGDDPKPGGWWFIVEPELHLGSDIVVPDIAGWRRSRLPSVPNVAAIKDAPDWLCEVISPSTMQIDRGRKMRIYAREGVRHLWILDPLARMLEIYRLEDARWSLVATYIGDEAVRAEPFEAIALAMQRWWLS